jgi:hypothetical protein
MFKMGSHYPFGHLKHKLWSKERPRVKLGVWLLITKSQGSTWFPRMQVVCKWRAAYHWKALNEGYNFAWDLIAIGGQHAKLWAPKVVGVLVVGISGLALGNLETKCHLDVAPMERCREYYKGGGGGFPQVEAVVSLGSPRFPVARPSTKSVQTMH